MSFNSQRARCKVLEGARRDSEQIWQAWFRHIAPDRKGISFSEFCRQLSVLGYETDMAELWSSLKPSGPFITLKAGRIA